MVRMFEISMEVLMNDAFTEKEVRDVIKYCLKEALHLSHISVELSEKKVKDWVIDEDSLIAKKFAKIILEEENKK